MRCDVLIAGGGPAGLAAAIALRARGADVVVADAVKPPIDKACGEGLMPDARRDLARLGIDLNARDGAEFRGILFAGHFDPKQVVGGQLRVCAEFPAGAGIGVRRPWLHRRLLERAEELGVRTFWNMPVLLAPGEAPSLGKEPIACRWFIGADGNTSRVRAWAGLERATIRSRRFGFRAHFRVPPWSDHVEVHWGPAGQAYVTPVGPEEIGIAAITRDPHTRLADFLATIPFLHDKVRGASMTSAERGSLTLTRRLHRVTRGNVALIGDASGSADAVTGEGLALGFRQALLLAESLDRETLAAYEARHARILALPQRMAALLMLLDRSPALRRRALAVMAARPEIFRAMLAVHMGEEPLPRFLWRHGAEFTALLLAPRLA